MKRMILFVALTLVFVLALSTVAMALPYVGANNNPLGPARAAETRQPFGAAQSAFVADINAGRLYPQWANYGDFLTGWMTANGFK